MGLLNDLFGNTRSKKKRRIEVRSCRFEQMESRELLSVNPLFAPPDDIDVGVLYHETGDSSATARDSEGDTFSVTWNGGGQGTHLASFRIQLQDTLFFHTGTAGGDEGVDGCFHFDFAEQDGIDVSSWEVDSHELIVYFTRFDAGSTFTFTIDVDELGSDGTWDPSASGAEFADSVFDARFSSSHYRDTRFQGAFSNRNDLIPTLGGRFDSLGDYLEENNVNNVTFIAGLTGTAEPQSPQNGSISGYVYEDDDNDGIKGNGEKGIGAVELELLRWNDGTGRYERIGEGLKTTTDANGFYTFDDLAAWSLYRVVEVEQPDGYVSGKNTPGTVDGGLNDGGLNDDANGVASDADDWISVIAVGANQHLDNYNFGELRKGSLSGYVYADTDDNGVRNPNEAGISGVELDLLVWSDEANGYVFLAKTTTGADGAYRFSALDPLKKYKIVESQPDGYISGKNTPGTIDGNTVGRASDPDDWISAISLGINQNGIHYNFGELDRELYAGSLSGYVYVDTNDDGTKDPGEIGIGGVTIHLWVREPGVGYTKIRSAVTNPDGSYRFDDLDPNRVYRITEEQPDDYLDGKDRPGTLGGTAVNPGDDIHSIFVPLAGAGTDYDFGEKEKPVVPAPEPGSLAGHVYVDADRNGRRDAGERGIAGVTVTLWRFDTAMNRYVVVATKTTDADGAYSFADLAPGVYRVSETQPTAYDDGSDTIGSLGGTRSANDVIDEIDVGEDRHGVGYDFGELEKVVIEKPGSIGGHVYEDDDNDGVFDGNEKGIPGVTVALCVWDATLGRFVATDVTTVTDGNGAYRFDNLPPGEKTRSATTAATWPGTGTGFRASSSVRTTMPAITTSASCGEVI